MAKAADDTNINFLSADWLSLSAAYAQFRERAGSHALAISELYQALLDGRLKSGLIHDPQRGILPREFWRQVELYYSDYFDDGLVRFRPRPGLQMRGRWHFFVWRSDLDAIFHRGEEPEAPAVPVATAAMAETKPEPKKFQAERIARALQKRYPNGVAKETSTAAVHAAVVAELDTETKRLGLHDPSYTSIARAIGRRPR
jgi:hypothetical protein